MKAKRIKLSREKLLGFRKLKAGAKKSPTLAMVGSTKTGITKA